MKFDIKKVNLLLVIVLIFVWIFILKASIAEYPPQTITCEILGYYSVINLVFTIALAIKQKSLKYAIYVPSLILLLPFWKYANNTLYLVFFCLSITFIFVMALLAFIYERKALNKSVNYYTIKQALDNVKVGLLFEDSSSLIYENKQMRSLLESLGVKRNLKVKSVWEKLKKCDCSQIDVNTINIKIDDKFYSFRYIFEKGVHQIISFNITKETLTTNEIENKQEELSQKQIELKNMLGSVAEIEKTKEIINMKSKVHDIIGQRLFIIHQVLNTMEARESDMKTLKLLVSSMLNEIQTNQDIIATTFQDNLIESFALAGLSIKFNGNLPANETESKAIIKIIRECATNAIRHANATELYVDISDNRIQIYDNGKPKRLNFIEGTGIKGMRLSAESIGANLIIDNSKKFKVIIEGLH